MKIKNKPVYTRESQLGKSIGKKWLSIYAKT